MKPIKLIVLVLFPSITILSQPQTPLQTDSSKPFVLGIIETMASIQLAEKRILNIYLPEGYSNNDTVRYPVIYLLDGSADEDFIHIAGLVQFDNLPWVNRVPKSIVVGIANIDRRRDFTYPTTVDSDKKRSPTSGKSKAFIAFLETELLPFIDKKFKTNSSKTLIGESLGGLLATEILFKNPKLFTNYIIVSPSIWWDNASLLKQKPEILQKEFLQKTQVYIGVGKEGLAPTETPHVMEVEANLLAEKLKSAENRNLVVFFDFLSEENHATMGHQAVSNAFRLVYAPKQK